MVRNLMGLAVTAVLLGGCVCVHETERVCDDGSSSICTEAVQVKTPVSVLRHVVLFQFKEGTTPAEIRKIENAFSALPSKIDAIYGFEWGTDVSVEEHEKGFTHCFVVTFLSEADRAVYLPHSASWSGRISKTCS